MSKAVKVHWEFPKRPRTFCGLQRVDQAKCTPALNQVTCKLCLDQAKKHGHRPVKIQKGGLVNE